MRLGRPLPSRAPLSRAPKSDMVTKYLFSRPRLTSLLSNIFQDVVSSDNVAATCYNVSIWGRDRQKLDLTGNLVSPRRAIYFWATSDRECVFGNLSQNCKTLPDFGFVFAVSNNKTQYFLRTCALAPVTRTHFYSYWAYTLQPFKINLIMFRVVCKTI